MRLIGGTGVAVMASAFLAGLFSSSFLLLSAYLSILTFITIYYGLKYSDYFYSLFIINLSAILASCMMPTLHDNLYHVILIAVLVVLALILQLVFFPGFVRFEVRAWTEKALGDLDRLNQALFACLLQQDYADNIYLYERRVHVCKMKYMRTMSKLRVAARFTKRHLPTAKIDDLYDILIDAGQLRRRVSDHTIFAICHNELTNLMQAMSVAFSAMIQISHEKSNNEVIDTLLLDSRIKFFEDNFQNVLRVTAREPLAFVLYIASLKAFKEKVSAYE